IVLAAGNRHADGLHDNGIISLMAWETELEREVSRQWHDEHRGVLRRLGVACEPSDCEWVRCRFDESSARAFQLVHVFLHELGHHHDQMTTRSRKSAARGESYAEGFAVEREAVVWERYARELA